MLVTWIERRYRDSRMNRRFPSWLRSAGFVRIAVPALVVVLGVGGYVLTSDTIRSDRNAAASRQAQIVSVRTEGFLGRARAYAIGLEKALATEPVAGQKIFAQVVGRWAAAAGLVDGLWVQRKGGSRLVATYTRRTVGDLRPGVDVSDWAALGAAIRERPTAFVLSASELGSLEGQPGFFLVDVATFGRAPISRGFLVLFVPRGWLTSSLESDPQRLAISLEGRRLEGALASAPVANARFETLGRRWRIDVGREPPTKLQSTLPWLALGWPLAVALLAFLIGRAIVLRRRAEREVEQIFDLSRDLLAVAGLDGYFKRVNPAFERTFGYSTEELLARPFMELIHPEDLERSSKTMEVLGHGQEVTQFENRNMRSDGSVRWIEWSSRPVTDEGIVYSIGRDVTESRRAAEEQAALRRVATLVARGAPPNEILDAVSLEVYALLGAHSTALVRYEPDGDGLVRSVHGQTGGILPVGTRIPLEGDTIRDQVMRTRRPARLENFNGASAFVANLARKLGIQVTIGVPVIVEDHIWGVTLASWTEDKPLLGEAERRMAAFTELVATAISNTQARSEVERLAEEQAALRRVATLVSSGALPSEVFGAVTDEVGRLTGLDLTMMVRFEPDGLVTPLAGAGTQNGRPGEPFRPEASSVMAEIRLTGRTARLDDYAQAPGRVAGLARTERAQSTVACPIIVEGRLWGALGVASKKGPLPSETEQRIMDFTELVANALANAESRAELAASRARIVTAADETRRRIERDLHDGTQQRLISLVLSLRAAESMVPAEFTGLKEELAEAAGGLVEATDDLREISRGIHPAILSQGGLEPALKTLVRRATVPARLDVHVDERLSESVEVAAYYVVSEALANAAKHAQASEVHVALTTEDAMVAIAIHDDGVGGADPGRGTGLTGLRDRIEALGGTIKIASGRGRGTSVLATFPLRREDAFEDFSGGA